MESDHRTDGLTTLVFGMGAIGTYIGGSLLLAGQSVVFVERPEVAEVVGREGLSLTVNGNRHKIPSLEVVTSAIEAMGKKRFDVCVLAVKSFDTKAIISSLQPVIEEIPPILCLQNGVENEQLLVDAFGVEKVIYGTVTTAVGKSGAGQIAVEKLRGIGIGNQHSLSARIISIFNKAGLHASGYGNPRGMKWSKMITNLLANASSAILDLPPAVIFAHPGLFRVEMRMLKEAMMVMKALDIPVVDLPSTPVRALMAICLNLPAFLSQPLLYQALGKGRGGKMPSFHIDLYMGRGNSEVEFLNGAVERFGMQVGIATPINAWMNRVLLQLTRGELLKEALAHQPDKFIEWLGKDQSSSFTAKNGPLI